ncbi:cell division protein, FtsN [Shewanella sp. HN-41]|nr:cell division protein, FtsN [Shewanella sp. HN-41]
MSNRDYANRRPQSGAKPRPIRATRARPAQKKAAPHKRLPLALILFAFIAVGCFGYFLWSIKDTAKQTASQTAAVKTEPRTKAQEPAATLTPKVKETDRQAVEVTVPVDEPAVAVVPKKRSQCSATTTKGRVDLFGRA